MGNGDELAAAAGLVSPLEVGTKVGELRGRVGFSGLGRALPMAESGPIESRLSDCLDRTLGSMPANVLSKAETARAKMPGDLWGPEMEWVLWCEALWLVASEDDEAGTDGREGVGMGFKFLSYELLALRFFVSGRDGCRDRGPSNSRGEGQ